MTTQTATRTTSESHRWIDDHGDFLYRFAFARVRNPDVAEDLVQETFLAALQGASFQGGLDAERRWMIGIIKHKIVDYFRKTAREFFRDSNQANDSAAEEDFLPDGHWNPAVAVPRGWPDNPDGLLERKQFWNVFAGCLGKLPPRVAQVFTLREIDEIATEEICRLLRLTPSNLGVILHRARKQLRSCLSIRYFGRSQEVDRP